MLLNSFRAFFYPLIYPPSNLVASTRILKGLIVLTFLHLRIDSISTIPTKLPTTQWHDQVLNLFP